MGLFRRLVGKEDPWELLTKAAGDRERFRAHVIARALSSSGVVDAIITNQWRSEDIVKLYTCLSSGGASEKELMGALCNPDLVRFFFSRLGRDGEIDASLSVSVRYWASVNPSGPPPRS